MYFRRNGMKIRNRG